MPDGVEVRKIENPNVVMGSSQKLVTIDDIPLDPPVAEKEIGNHYKMKDFKKSSSGSSEELQSKDQSTQDTSLKPTMMKKY